MVAISIKNGWLRWAQTDVSEHEFTVNQIEDVSLSRDLATPDLRSPRLSERFEALFQKVTASLRVPDREVFLSLGSEWIECHLMCVDRGLFLDEKEAYLRWVLAQRLGSLWSDSVAFFYPIANDSEDLQRVIACTTTSNAVESIQSALDHSGAIPAWLEPSLLSIHRVIIESNHDEKSKVIAIRSNGNSLSAQFLCRNELRGLAMLAIKSGDLFGFALQGDGKFVRQCIDELNDYLRDKLPSPDLQVWLAGRFSKRHLDALRRNDGEDEVSMVIDPFEGVEGEQCELPDATNGSPYVEIAGLIRRRVG